MLQWPRSSDHAVPTRGSTPRRCSKEGSEVAVPEPAEQYSKAAKKNFRRRQNRRARKAAANVEQHLTVAAGVDSRANWTVVKDGDTAVKQTIAVKQTSVAGATAQAAHKSQSAMSIKTVDDFNYTKISQLGKGKVYGVVPSVKAPQESCV
eukprot:jgi/Picre1/31316/NNA_006669.t1